MSAEAPTNCWNEIGIWGDRSCPELSVHGHCRNCPVYAESAVRLLDAEVSSEYLNDGAKHYAQAKEESRSSDQSVIVFRVASEWFALLTTVFHEIAPCRPVHSLPHRRSGLVNGIVNIRGELLVCMSLSAALGLNAKEGELPTTARHMVVGSGAERFVFVASEIAGLLRFEESELLSVPATVSHARAVHTRGLLKWRESQVGLLDDGLLFHTFNRGMS